MIRQPKNIVIKGKNVSASLIWSTSFGKDKSKSFTQAQMFVDSECMRLMVKYTPERTGFLYRSVTLGSKIGSGKLVYLAPYARYQYYGVSRSGRKLKYAKPTARPMWFEVMKANHGASILRGAARIAGGHI